ncbi:MAG: hypothetical protein WBM44_25125 [Waterburya sp.]
MTILSQEEFKQKSSPGANSLEKIYQGRSIKGGPVFSLGHLQTAELYCEKFSRKQAGSICIIVKEKSFLRIWSENFEISPEISLNATNDVSLSENETEISPNSLPVQADFADFCQKTLANYIGPIAQMICKKTLANKPNLSRTEFVGILAKKISDPNQAQEFQQAVLD